MFQHCPKSNGAWAQDAWGIVNNTLLARENLEDKTNLWRMFLGLETNITELKKQEELGVNKLYQFVNLLSNVPSVKKNGKEFVRISTPNDVSDVDKAIYKQYLQSQIDNLVKLSNQSHIKGGNYFITKGLDGKEEVLIWQDELKKFDLAQLKEMFQTEKIHIIPQADYHLDLFIRPLKNKKVLIADDNLMSQILFDGLNKIKEMVVSKPKNYREKYKDVFINVGIWAENFKRIIKENPFANMDKVEEALIKGGYKPIRVPGRIFEISPDGSILRHLQNYLNASVHINDKGEIVYITNKSAVDESLKLTDKIKKETGFNPEESFKKAISHYVDKIYFVSGKNNAIGKELLPKYLGGIHCMTMEVPSTVLNI